MAIYHVDLENGNDANDGSSWANAWKTISAKETLITAGDTIKFAKTPDPVSIGNALWTNLSKEIILDTAQTKTIDNCETAWIRNTSGNLSTSNFGIYNGIRKQGNYCMRCITATSMVASTLQMHKALPSSLDLSAYQEISFYLWISNVINYDTLRLCLCSDNNGAVIVDSFIVPAVTSFRHSNNFFRFTIKRQGGGNLGNNINSIALYTGTDTTSVTSARTIYLDNIIASKTGGLNLNTLISKTSLATGGNEAFFGIQSIDDTSILLDNAPGTLSNQGRGYYGTTETVETYIRQAYELQGSFITQTKSGTEENHIIYEGGYNITTDLKDGETYLDNNIGLSNGIYSNQYSAKYTDFLNVSFFRFNYAVYLAYNGSTYNTYSGQDLNNNAQGFYTQSQPIKIFVNYKHINNNGAYGVYFLGYSSEIVNANQINNNLTAGVYFGRFRNKITGEVNSISNNGQYGLHIISYGCFINKVGVLEYNATNDIYALNANSSIFEDITIGRSSGISIMFTTSSYCRFNNLKVIGRPVTTNYLMYVVNSIDLVVYGNLTLDNPTSSRLIYSDNSIVYFRNLIANYSQLAFGNGENNGKALIYFHNLNEVENIVYSNYDYCKYQTVVKQGSDTGSLEITKSWQNNPMFKIAEIAFEANKLVVVKLWMLKNSTVSIFMQVDKNAFYGIAEDVISESMGASGVWTRVTLEFTPTKRGVVPLYVYATSNVVGTHTYYAGSIWIVQES
jgi:hypothetical protein